MSLEAESDEAFARRLQEEEIAAARRYGYGYGHQHQHGRERERGPSEVDGPREPLLDRYAEYIGDDVDRNNAAAGAAPVAAAAAGAEPVENANGLAGAAVGPNRVRTDQRQVHAVVAENLINARHSSPRLFALYIVVAVAEMVSSSIVATLTWEKPCDRPLQLWVLLFTGRYLILIPLQYRLYRIRRQPHLHQDPSRRVIRIKAWMDFVTFFVLIMGQYWVYGSDSCSSTAPVLYRYAFVLILLIYASMLLPFLLLLALCLCLPCVILFIRIIAENPGANVSQISDIPTRIFQESETRRPGSDNNNNSSNNGADTAATGTGTSTSTATATPRDGASSAAGEDDWEAPTCSICISEFVAGDVLRILPCKHEFHQQCIDQWLHINHSCPLCRQTILVYGRNSDPDAVDEPRQVAIDMQQLPQEPAAVPAVARAPAPAPAPAVAAASAASSGPRAGGMSMEQLARERQERWAAQLAEVV